MKFYPGDTLIYKGDTTQTISYTRGRGDQWFSNKTKSTRSSGKDVDVEEVLTKDPCYWVLKPRLALIGSIKTIWIDK